MPSYTESERIAALEARVLMLDRLLAKAAKRSDAALALAEANGRRVADLAQQVAELARPDTSAMLHIATAVDALAQRVAALMHGHPAPAAAEQHLGPVTPRTRGRAIARLARDARPLTKTRRG